MNNKKSWYDGELSEKDIVRIKSNSEDCVVDYNKNNGMYRVSIFNINHFLDEFWFEAYEDKEVPVGFPECSVGDVVYYNDCKCKVSMLQQKADKSWKIRLTPPSGNVFDITLDEFNEHCYFTKEEFETKSVKIKKLPKFIYKQNP